MMQHVVTSPSAPFRSSTGRFEVHQLPAWRDNFVWLLVCTRTGAAAVIDGPDAEATLAYAKAHGITLTHILNTHTHPDHIGINDDLQRRGLLSDLTVYGAAKTAAAIPGLTCGLSDGDTLEVGACKARVMLTEGHIKGHLCFVFDDVLFSGDHLFAGGCGRVFTGDHAAMHEGLERLAQLDPGTRFCCGHEYTQDQLRFAYSVEPGNAALSARIRETWQVRKQGGSTLPSTIAAERATNPMLRWHSAELLAEVRKQAPGADLSSPLAIFTATRKLKDAGGYQVHGDAGLPL
jgi:hydroxyacylglutathione hydrolase